VKAYQFGDVHLQLTHITTLHFAIPYAYDCTVFDDICDAMPNLKDLTVSHDEYEFIQDYELVPLDGLRLLEKLKLVCIDGVSGSFLIGRFPKLNYLELRRCTDVTILNLMQAKRKCNSMRTGKILIAPHRNSDKGAMFL
jgi:hypothetical protein